MQYIAKRGGGGWSTRSIDPPRDSNFLIGLEYALEASFQVFTPDLCQSFYRQDNEYALAPGTPPGWPNLYRRTDTECGGEPDFETLIPVAPTNILGVGQIRKYALYLIGFSADAQTTVIAAPGALAPDANPDPIPEEEGAQHHYQLYVTDGAGGLRLGSVLPDGGPALGTLLARRGIFSELAARFATPSPPTARCSTGARGGEQLAPLYLRLNPTRPQSPPHTGKGDLTNLSPVISGLVAAKGKGDLTSGSTEVSGLETTQGEFAAGAG